MINIFKALDVAGWMQEKELLWLAEHASQHSLIVEVGSYHGRSTRALGDHTSGKVIAVDTWDGPVDWKGEKLDSFLDIFKINLTDLIESGKVTPITPTQVDLFVTECPDMVFIDADHSYAAVRKDIEFWKNKIAAGGLLCGHDSGFDDVQKALNELVPNYKVDEGTSIWYATL